MVKKKERLFGADLIRVISTIAIVFYHIGCKISSIVEIGSMSRIPFLEWGGVNCGDIFVTVFFILSGAMLYRNNRKVDSLRQFYYKRWKSIFPTFYFVYGILFLKNVLTYKTVFYKGNPMSLLLSVCGLDGYFQCIIDNYYIVGEWFLGAIILLYLVYPILAKLAEKGIRSTTVILTCVYLMQVLLSTRTDVFGISSFRNIASCLISFWFGIVFMYAYDSFNKFMDNRRNVLILIIVILAILPVISIVESNIAAHLLGALVFVTLWGIGLQLSGKTRMEEFIAKCSQCSFAVYMCHHVIVNLLVLRLSKLTHYQYLIVYSAVGVICYIAGWCINRLVNQLLSSSPYRRFEANLLGARKNKGI